MFVGCFTVVLIHFTYIFRWLFIVILIKIRTCYRCEEFWCVRTFNLVQFNKVNIIDELVCRKVYVRIQGQHFEQLSLSLSLLSLCLTLLSRYNSLSLTHFFLATGSVIWRKVAENSVFQTKDELEMIIVYNYLQQVMCSNNVNHYIIFHEQK